MQQADTAPLSNTAPLLAMQGISKSFPGVRALEHVDFELNPAEIHALIGKNGAGKSTLIRILGGIYRPDRGRILINGQEVELSGPNAAISLGIAIVHQELSLVPGLSVAENIFLGRWRLGMQGWKIPWLRLHRQANEVLTRLTTEIDLRQRVSELSVAQQQIIEIAKALSREPRLLIMDEPTSSLSLIDADRLLAIVTSLPKAGVAIIYISHRLGEVEKIADRITVLRDGRTVNTSIARNVDRSGIVRLMLGEELSRAHARAPAEAARRIVLSVRHLSQQGTLTDISFDLHEGEILGIAGLVGAGRSELVRAIIGRDRIDHGEIFVDGQKVKRPTPSRMRCLGIGLTPEDRKRQGIVLGLSVQGNLVLTVLQRLTRGFLVQHRTEKMLVERIINELQIKVSNPSVPVRTLSGGNQQK
ncbi:MAG: sugar ABC transporter ATP-binding protein, partial [Verrucomicrobia bacterium]|nr:sugar ABC transporter ATP-binding protein [Verrucomicrobiota bacterium]